MANSVSRYKPTPILFDFASPPDRPSQDPVDPYELERKSDPDNPIIEKEQAAPRASEHECKAPSFFSSKRSRSREPRYYQTDLDDWSDRSSPTSSVDETKEEAACASEPEPNRRGQSPRAERGALSPKRKIDLARAKLAHCHPLPALIREDKDFDFESPLVNRLSETPSYLDSVRNSGYSEDEESYPPTPKEAPPPPPVATSRSPSYQANRNSRSPKRPSSLQLPIEPPPVLIHSCSLTLEIENPEHTKLQMHVYIDGNLERPIQTKLLPDQERVNIEALSNQTIVITPVTLAPVMHSNIIVPMSLFKDGLIQLSVWNNKVDILSISLPEVPTPKTPKSLWGDISPYAPLSPQAPILVAPLVERPHPSHAELRSNAERPAAYPCSPVLIADEPPPEAPIVVAPLVERPDPSHPELGSNAERPAAYPCSPVLIADEPPPEAPHRSHAQLEFNNPNGVPIELQVFDNADLESPLERRTLAPTDFLSITQNSNQTIVILPIAPESEEEPWGVRLPMDKIKNRRVRLFVSPRVIEVQQISPLRSDTPPFWIHV